MRETSGAVPVPPAGSLAGGGANDCIRGQSARSELEGCRAAQSQESSASFERPFLDAAAFTYLEFRGFDNATGVRRHQQRLDCKRRQAGKNRRVVTEKVGVPTHHMFFVL